MAVSVPSAQQRPARDPRALSHTVVVGWAFVFACLTFAMPGGVTFALAWLAATHLRAAPARLRAIVRVLAGNGALLGLAWTVYLLVWA